MIANCMLLKGCLKLVLKTPAIFVCLCKFKKNSTLCYSKLWKTY